MWWQTGRKRWDLREQARVMGILNVTPDSFSDGGIHESPVAALEHARRMIGEGADLIDVGGESTRPGAEPVSLDEEIRRVVPVIRALRAEWEGSISVDTMKPEVAAAAIDAGADVVNDVSGLRVRAMVDLCRERRVGVVVMHMQGLPRTMQLSPEYDDVVEEVRSFLAQRHEELTGAGIDPECLVYDPGIGFGKTLEHNLALLRAGVQLASQGRPLLIGLSRKRFIGSLLGVEAVESRSWPTVALTAWTRERGAMIHRVHEVRPNREALTMVEAIRGRPTAGIS